MRFVPVDALEPGMVLGRDIITPKKSHMLKKGVILTDSYIVFLQTKGYLGAYIADADSMDIMPTEPVSASTIISSIEAMEAGDVDAIVESASKIVSDISMLSRLSIDLLDLRAFDDYTYHHSVNVSVYAVAVGKYMGLKDKDLLYLSQAGVLHDIGKERIPIEILNKPGRLTDDEFNMIKSHPQYSYEILYGNPEVSAIVRQAVLFHHENENGSGYPLGKEGSQIPLYAKIIHAVDVYDALTSRRPYKNPYAPVDAFEYLFGGKGVLFDAKVVDAMTKVIPAYPPGIEVILSTGESALVLTQSNDYLRPIVRVKGSKRKLDLSDDANKDITIEASGIMQLDYVGTIEKLNESRQAVKELKKKILVVDDSAMSLQQIISAITNESYSIIPMHSGTEVINYVKEKGVPDVLLIDVDMPIMNGIATVANLKKMNVEKFPIVFLTDKADRDTILKCREIGATDIILKPAKPTYLNERLTLALDKNSER